MLYEVITVGVIVRIFRVLMDLKAGNGYAGCIGEAQIFLADKWFGGNNLCFSRPRFPVIAKRFVFQ